MLSDGLKPLLIFATLLSRLFIEIETKRMKF
jgi:hypothetical protein